ncbi:MAG: hypothetical protein QHJ73_19490, partial [Armatimonadota bacterium]|nr:hypothetical protein [Armatimonadota bacterium]
AESARSVIFQADGMDRLADRLRDAGDAATLNELRQWLTEKRAALRAHNVVFVGTGREAAKLPKDLLSGFDRAFVTTA